MGSGMRGFGEGVYGGLVGLEIGYSGMGERDAAVFWKTGK